MTQSPPRDAGPVPGRSTYPSAPRSGPREVVHGVCVADPYRWLEDPRDPATAAWCAAQDVLYADEEARWPARDALLVRMTALLAGGGARPPVARGGREFHLRREPGRELAALAVREAGRTRILLDPLDADPSGTTVLDAWEPSWEGDLVAVQLSSGGTEHSVLRVLDTATGETVDGPVDRVRRSPVAWLPGGHAFYYVRRLSSEHTGGGTGLRRRVYLHRVGTPADQDTEIFGAGRSDTQYYTVATAPDGRLLVVGAGEGTSPRTDLWTADLTATAPTGRNCAASSTATTAAPPSASDPAGDRSCCGRRPAPRAAGSPRPPATPWIPAGGAPWSPSNPAPYCRTSRSSTARRWTGPCWRSYGPGTPSAS